MIIYACSLDHYGEVAPVALQSGTDGAPLTALIGDGWSDYPRGSGSALSAYSGSYSIQEPSWGARQGDYALIADSVTGAGGLGGPVTWTGGEGFRLTIPGSLKHTNLIHFAFGCDALPSTDLAHGHICTFQDSSGNLRGALAVSPSGRLQIIAGDLTMPNQGTAYDSLPTALLTSSSPVVEANTWYFISMSIVTNASDANADVSVYVGDIDASNLVVSGTAALTDTGNNEIATLGFLPISAALSQVGTGGTTNIDETVRAVRDIVLCDTTGSYNTTLLGQCYVSAQEMRDEDSGGGWTPYPREKLGTGILDHTTTTTGLRFADSATLEIGAQDFTFETFIRFDTAPGTGETATVMAKWRAAAGQRSYKLDYNGTDGELVWTISTDGSAETEVKAVPWVPLTDRWYHMAVVRSSSETMFFIDGEQLGVPVADASTYHNGTEYFGIGTTFDSSGDPDSAAQFDGWLDETRFTIGTARYTADFTPTTAKFGRSVGADVDFGDVVVLLGYDNAPIVDESSYTRTITLDSTSPVTVLQPTDGDDSYAVLNERTVVDDTYIEAEYLTAEGIFTFTDVPSVGETMTVGTQTYTWVSTFSTVATDEVLIGADIGECITNIIAAINAGSGEGTLYGTGTTANADISASAFLNPQFKVTALSPGSSGNSLATTETMADGSFGASTLEDGADIPDDSDFAIERLPTDTTGVLGGQVTSRLYKTDAGSTTMRFDLIGPSAGVGAGDAISPDLSPSWKRQVFEEDPDTSAQMTVSTLNSGRIRIKRLS